ncbi:IclR family transcriptional regulator [Agromyces sp. Leaf222]|uniref:IclR family transcriptional regulator n=1 Tax=Agromyces sp. Leaf222 TaxID=1735688 RepID=UPI0006F4DB24|nr:IclR family transcriptional regulator [Agromyces sp. Leaf222]KQM82982.1 transcriptional regulator [Agromyces sp. Leaf222]
MSDESDAKADRQGRDPAPAVTRSMRILGLLAEASGPLTLTEIASGLGLAKSSTANLCLALEAAMMVQRVPLGYQLGRRTIELGGAYASQFSQVREFYTVCETSPVLVHEVVQVAMLDDTEALYLARHEGSRSVRFGTPLGSRLPAALSATGNALLMAMDDADVAALLSDQAPFPRLTDRSIRDIPDLLVKLAAARDRGWALDDGESFPGIVGVAVPLEGWAPSDPSLALGVALPVAEATPGRVASVAAALVDAAARLTNPLSAGRSRA